MAISYARVLTAACPRRARSRHRRSLRAADPAPTMGRCCAAVQRSRRCAFTGACRFVWMTISSGSRTPPRSCDCRGPTRPRFPSWRTLRWPPRECRRRAAVVWTPGRDDGDPVGFALVTAISDRLEQERAVGMRLVALRLAIGAHRAAALAVALPGVKSTSYAVNIAAQEEARRRGADDAVFLSLEGIVLEGPDLERVDARAGEAADAVTRPWHPGGRHPRHAAGIRGRRWDRGGGGVVPADTDG